MRHRRPRAGPKNLDNLEAEPLPKGGLAQLREEQFRQDEEQARKWSEIELESPVLLSARVARVVEHVFGLLPGREPWGEIVNPTNLADPTAVVMAAAVLWNKVPPAFVVHFLERIPEAGNLTARALYVKLLDLMQDELREEAPPGCWWDEDAGNDLDLPPMRISWSVEDRYLFGKPEEEKPEALERGGPRAERRPLRNHEEHGMLRRGLPRAWFGADAFNQSDDEDWGQVRRPRRPAQKGDLPILEKKAEICRLIQQNQVVLLQGETGCGKTTQVPQFVLEMAKNDQEKEPDRPIRVVCTQPRRIAAITVAQRVADERGEVVGEGSVGYKIRGATVSNKDCELMFCTIGVLLRRIIYEGRKWMFSPKTVTHLLVDEVHERSADVDFLLTFVRDMSQIRPNLRIILMSATLDTKSFLRYFSVSRGGKIIEPPMINIPGFMFPVSEVYLETIAMKCGYHKALEARSPGEVWNAGHKHDDVDCQLIAQLIDDIYHSTHGPWDFVVNKNEREQHKARWATAEGGAESKGSILVFLPGVHEINDLMSALKMQRSAPKLWVLPLHASLPPEDQQLCFETILPQGFDVKVICATNVAETSVTVPDVVIVIDSCRHRLNMMEKGSNVATLKMQWCAKNSIKQRRGRAGRVQPGVCFRLLLEEDQDKLEDTTPPEMVRVPLENLYLQSCASGITDVPGFLARTPDPPSKLAIQLAEVTLRDIGALDDSAPDKLSQLGRVLGALPTHPRIGKMLVIGCLFGCHHEVLSIAGFLAARNPLITAPDARKGQWLAARDELVRHVGFCSDHLAWALMLSDWEILNIGQRRQMAQRYGVVFERMNEAIRERVLLGESLMTVGLLSKEILAERMDSRNRARWPLVVAALVAGMYPNILLVEHCGERARGHSDDVAERAMSLRYSVLQRHHSKQDAMCYPKPLHMHPNSICFGAVRYHCPLMTFFNSQQTTKLYCYDATEATPWAILLFGEQPEYVETESSRNLVVGGWSQFRVSDSGALRIIDVMRKSFANILAKKLTDLNWDHHSNRELMVIKRVLLDQGLGFEIIQR